MEQGYQPQPQKQQTQKIYIPPLLQIEIWQILHAERYGFFFSVSDFKGLDSFLFLSVSYHIRQQKRKIVHQMLSVVHELQLFHCGNQKF